MVKQFSKTTRSRMSASAKQRCTPEWRQQVSERLATKLPKAEVVSLYQSGVTQTELAEYFGVTQKVIWGFMQRHGIKSRKAAKRNQWGSRNHMWKGDDASYKAMHQRLTKRFGQPQRCEVCGTTDKRRRYDWASLSGQYQDMGDYRRMCRSCHWKYDKIILNIKCMRERKAARD